MKNFKTALLLGVAVALLAAACSGSGAGEEAGGERIELLWVGPEVVECEGAFPQTCLQVSSTEDGEVGLFYDFIEGFDHVDGNSYVLRVGVTDVEDPPADASSLSYRLIEIINQTNESATGDAAIDDAVADETVPEEPALNEPAAGLLDGTAWRLIGYRAGDLFDMVPDTVSVTIEFDGDSASGSSGCNSYSAGFSTDGDAITIGPVQGTLMACDSEVMGQEQRFLSIIETVEAAEITADERLVLRPAAGLTLVFVAQ